MNIQITKSHLFLFLSMVIISIAAIALGQSNPNEFGHNYDELMLRDSQGKGLISAQDIQNILDDGKNYIKLNVLRSKYADNALAARCDLKIIECNGITINNQCKTGYYQTQGWFSFSGSAQDETAQCSSGGKMSLCCKGI